MTWTTDQGKEIKIFHVTNSGMYKIAFANGGELPEEFKGKFTSKKEAEKTITRYLNRKSKTSQRRTRKEPSNVAESQSTNS